MGCGYTGTAVAVLARARGQQVFATVRSEARAAALRKQSIAVRADAELQPEFLEPHIDASTHVVVAYPGEPVTDARLAPVVARAGALTYVSSTGVYDEHEGVLDQHTPVPARPSERARRLLDAEQRFVALGASVLRCPGIYGPDRGLHMRVLRGEHRIAGDGRRWLSRIHVADLAQLLLAAGAHAARPSTFVVGDREPALQIDVVRFICETYRVPMPPHVPLDHVHVSLRANRRVDPSHALSMLGVTLHVPSFRVGMAPTATGITPGALP